MSEQQSHLSAGTSEQQHSISIGTYLAVFAALMILTVVTVISAHIDLGHFNIVVALVVAFTKATLVVTYFMHLRYENRLFTFMLLAAIFTYAVFVILTFADYSYRMD